MRIVMDLQGAQSESRFRGIGRYTLSLALAAAQRSRGHDIRLVLNGAFTETVPAIREAFRDLVPQQNIHVWHVPLPVEGMHRGNAARVRRAELIREAAIAALEPDVVHVSSLFDGYGDHSVTSVGQLFELPTVVTMYDLIPLKNPATYLDPAPSYKEFYQGKLAQLRRANGLLAISESAAAEAVDMLGVPAHSLFNISAACDATFFPLSPDAPVVAEVRAKFGLETDFILYSGGSDERKNLRRLVDAYAQLRLRQRKYCRLVFAGRIQQAHVDELLALGAAAGLDADELVFIGYVMDKELHALYSECKFFVFPSWHEGFGLPVLEAMACGAAVLASDASSIREIAQYRDALFDPFDVDSIRERMAHYLDNDTELAALRAYSRERAASFSWERVAEAFWDACERIHAETASAKIKLSYAAVMEALETGLVQSPVETDHELMALADAIDRSIPLPTPKIIIDVTELAAEDRGTGIQRVTRAIVAEWGECPPEGYRIQLVRMDRQRRAYVCANVYAGSLLGDVEGGEDAPLVCHAGDIFLGLDLVGECVSLLPDWFEYFSNAGVRIAFVVYDILPIRNPEWWPGEGWRHHERWLSGIIGVSDALLCISKATADDVLAWMDEKKVQHRPVIEWFHLGADLEGSAPSRGMPEEGAALIQRLEGAVSFLMVGTIEPRKGYAQVLDAFERLWAEGEDVVLVIVGKKGWLVDDLCDRLSQHPERGGHLFWLNGASDEFLEHLYGACSCLLAASFAEGFGLPLIEAAQRRMPVLARDIPVFREVAGSCASYFDGASPVGLRDAIRTWSASFREGTHPRTDAMPWLTWRQSAEQLARAMMAPAGTAG